MQSTHPAGMPHLTAREHEVLALLYMGLMTKEIAQRLGLSYHTVRDHADSLREKFGVRTRAELITRVLEVHHPPQL